MNRKRLSTCFVVAGLVSVPAASVPAGGGTAGAAAPATAVSSADSCDADGAALPAGVTGKSWAQARAAIRELENSNRDVAAPSGARPNWKAEGDQAGAQFGNSVGTAGDVNGDGYDDVILGAPFYDNDNGQSRREGRALVYHGSASGLSTTADWTADGDQDHPAFGWSVGTAGDVNGDGYDDVIGAAPLYDHPHDAEGVAVVFHGRATAATPR
jgi:hypothetical protein